MFQLNKCIMLLGLFVLINSSKDVMMRWSYPLSPDNFSHDGETHSHSAHNIYKGSGLALDRYFIYR
jgi:hypothetical protein